MKLIARIAKTGPRYEIDNGGLKSEVFPLFFVAFTWHLTKALCLVMDDEFLFNRRWGDMPNRLVVHFLQASFFAPTEST